MDVPFPVDVQEFSGDDRISFSKLDNKFIAVHDDGTEFEFDADLKRWHTIDEEDLDLDDSHEYGGSGNNASIADETTSRKRKNGTNMSSQEPDLPRPSRPAKKQKQPPAPKQNTAVYVTGLPLDTTVSEVHDIFSHKAGVIAEEIDSGAPRIKLYTDSSGEFKGDALVVFFKPQSVEMAIMLLDDTDFRITSSGTREGRMRVQAADSSYKKSQYDQDNGAERSNNEASNQQQDRPSGNRDRDRKKIIKKTRKLDAKLADWDDDDPYPAQTEAVSRWDKMVVLRHMFTQDELEDDPAALLEIKEDIREECSKLGAVTNVVLFDLEQDGIVSVKFRDAESATACIRLMHGRSFDGRVVEATLATGQEKFQKSKEAKDDDDSD